MINLNQLVGWYQNKISKYDKNKWDSVVEHKPIKGYGKYLRPTKQKTDLIDVDTLVRGSLYAKAKPKQNLFNVLRLAFVRILLLPIYSKWWIEQTSRNIYNFLLTLYCLQVFNACMYTFVTIFCEKNIVTSRDVLIPSLLSFLLSVIHSQIVATDSSNRVKSQLRLQTKRRRPIRKISTKKSTTSGSSGSVKSTADPDGSTNCPQGLRKRNVDWNHVYSPYWLNKNRLESTVELNSEEATVESERNERSNIDYGFESFAGKSSSSDDRVGSPVRVNSQRFENQVNKGASQRTHNDRETSDQFLNVNPSLLSNGKGVKADVDEKGFLLASPMCRQPNRVVTSPWLGVTSNSDCSYSSGSESDSMSDRSETSRYPPLKPVSDKISCSLWLGNKMTKVEMSILDISTSITDKVETMTKSSDYIYIGLLLSVLLATVPVLCRICEAVLASNNSEFTILDIPTILMEKVTEVSVKNIAFGETFPEKLFLTIGLLLRFCLIALLFFMLSVAERTFKERLLYAKLFSHLTSSRRARKSEVPHFRLSKLRNIKTWLSVRSYLKRRGPQRSVDVIVSVTLMLCLMFVSFLCAESLNGSVQQNWQYDLELFIWSCSLGCFILRFMTLGTAVKDKYRSVSILITEQINLYLKMEHNPEKKENLTAANNVLKLAADLLKEIELPFKISGFNINPYLSAGIRVLIVSALSGICSEILGFKLKLFKFKE